MKTFSPKFFFILPLLTLLSYIGGIFAGIKILLPILNISFAYPLMIYLILNDKRREAVYSMLLWALSLIIFGTFIFPIFPERAESVVIDGREYREDMFARIKSGISTESPSIWLILTHLKQI